MLRIESLMSGPEFDQYIISSSVWDICFVMFDNIAVCSMTFANEGRHLDQGLNELGMHPSVKVQI